MRLVRSWLLIFAVLLLLVCLYRLFEGVQDWQKDHRLKQRYAEEIKKLERERERLRVRVENLKTNELTQERLARGLGYIKPGETVYKVVRSPKGAAPNHTKGDAQNQNQ